MRLIRAASSLSKLDKQAAAFGKRAWFLFKHMIESATKATRITDVAVTNYLCRPPKL
jgi:hypothetical protein